MEGGARLHGRALLRHRRLRGLRHHEEGLGLIGGHPGLPEPEHERDSVGLGIAAALAAALICGLVYGVIAGEIEIEIGWAALAVGFFSAYAGSKAAGGPNPLLTAAAAVFSVGGVYFGQLIAFAMINSREMNIRVTEMFFQHSDLVSESWDASRGPQRLFFFALAVAGAFVGARKAAK